LHARDTSFALVSIAPLAKIKGYRKRMGWTIPWFSSASSDFNKDFGVTTDEGETFGLSVFLRDGDSIYRTYFTAGRGVEALGSVWAFLDLPSRLGEFHPEPLTDPDLILSHHPARAIARRLPPSTERRAPPGEPVGPNQRR